MLGKIEGRGRRGATEDEHLDSITSSTGMNLSKLWKTVEDRGAWRAAVHGVTMSWTWRLNNIVLEIRNIKTKSMPGWCSLWRH